MKRFVAVGAHKRKFPKRRFASGGAERYASAGSVADDEESVDDAAFPTAPDGAETPAGPEGPAAPRPLAPETDMPADVTPATPPAKMGQRPPNTTPAKHQMPYWLKLLAGAGAGAGYGPLGVGSSLLGSAVLPLIFKHRQKDADSISTSVPKGAAQGGPIGGGAMGRTMRFQDGGSVGMTRDQIEQAAAQAAAQNPGGRTAAQRVSMAGIGINPITGAGLNGGLAGPSATPLAAPPAGPPSFQPIPNPGLGALTGMQGAAAAGPSAGPPGPSFQPIPNPGLGALTGMQGAAAAGPSAVPPGPS